MKVLKLLNQINFFISESVYNLNLFKSRLKNIMQANLNLCHFYVDGKYLKDAELRIKILKFFLRNNNELKFCEARLKLAQGNIEGAKSILAEIHPTMQNNPLVNYLYQLLHEEKFKSRALTKQLIKSYSSLLSNYDKNLYQELRQKIVNFIINNMTANNIFAQKSITIIDLGCGSGHLTQILSNQLSNRIDFKVTGIEFNEDCYKYAQMRNYYNYNTKNTEKIYQEIYKIDINEYHKFHDNKFDVILAINIIPYVHTLKEFFNTLKHLAHEKSRIFVSFYEGEAGNLPNYFAKLHTNDKINDLINQHGLKVVSETSLEQNEKIILKTLMLNQEIIEDGGR